MVNNIYIYNLINFFGGMNKVQLGLLVQDSDMRKVQNLPRTHFLAIQNFCKLKVLNFNNMSGFSMKMPFKGFKCTCQ